VHTFPDGLRVIGWAQGLENMFLELWLCLSDCRLGIFPDLILHVLAVGAADGASPSYRVETRVAVYVRSAFATARNFRHRSLGLLCERHRVIVCKRLEREAERCCTPLLNVRCTVPYSVPTHHSIQANRGSLAWATQCQHIGIRTCAREPAER
jgi:hypothetical protein